MRILWSVLALLLVAAIWAMRYSEATGPESCEPAPWELLDRARHDEVGAVKPVDSPVDGGATPGSTSRPSTDSDVPSAMPPGAGTERQPFRVSWELLGQASGHVRGDGSLDAMPRTLELLGGTWIELSGFYAPAIIAPSTDELVLMLNRWDGCCIGLPPTPYDSALVKTRAPIDFSLQHQIRFGTLRGRLVLEPFALGGLVLGLYRIEDAELLR
ncbi:MAG: hypothetical protein RL527_348 [Planctomycetota bacterium]|jgi:hypothetical protein